MTNSEVKKKLSTAERKQIQHNASLIERHIGLMERELVTRKEINIIRFSPENYVLDKGFQATMKYQYNEEHLELSRQLDMIKAEMEIINLAATIEERKEKLKDYKEHLSARG